MASIPHSSETQIALLTQAVAALKEHQEATDVEIEALRAERDKALKWGIATLGGLVLTLVSWIFTTARDFIIK